MQGARVGCVVGAAALVLLTACGTTVSPAQRTATGSGAATTPDGSTEGDPGSDAYDPSLGSSGPQARGPVGGNVTAGQNRGDAGGTAPGPAGSSAGTAGPAAVQPATQGVFRDKIVIGVETSEGADAYTARYGVKGTAQGSSKDRATALVARLNKQGGVGGRRIEVYFHDYPAGAPTQSEAEQQGAAACADFADHKVFAVIAGGNGHSESFIACLAKAKILLISEASSNIDDVVLQRYPNVLAPDGFSLNRKTPALIAALAARDYFAPWDFRAAAPSKVGKTKIGVIYIDSPLFQRNNKRIEAELAKHGLKVGDYFGVSPNSTDQGVSAVQSAVLQFASDGVDHVIFNDEAGGGFLIFAESASSQGYYPRYGVGSFDFPQGVRDNVPDDKVFEGLLGIGWLYSGQDVGPHPPLGARRQSCLKVFSDAGIAASGANEISLQLLDCEQWFIFAAAATKAAGDLSTQSFLSAAAASTDHFSYESFTIDLGKGRAGISAIGYLANDDSCKCIRYTKYPIAA